MTATPTLDQAWSRFDKAAAEARGARIVDLYAREPDRLARMRVAAAGLELDLSKQSWTGEAMDAVLDLVAAAGFEAARASMFAGEPINSSEGRAVLHTALRAPAGADFKAQGEPVSGEVEAGRAAMRALADKIRSGGKIKALVHIGIGGSDLGPRLLWEALRPVSPEIELRFVANVDPDEAVAALVGLDPASTLVVAVSKTFTTQETMANLNFVFGWLKQGLADRAGEHLVAVTAAPTQAAKFGVPADRVFGFRDWVGGRFSIWSAVGLSCAIALGADVFEAFLAGAAEMDAHFTSAPLQRNAPVLLAAAQIFNRNGLDRRARAVVPYARRLTLLPAFLQQLEMESNGKRATPDGRLVVRATAPVVFGDAGTNGQHAFFQLLHQGTDVIPVEILAAAEGEGDPDMRKKLLANAIAQAEALMVGRPSEEQPADRRFPGDRPSSFILLERLDARSLGALIALYEHKTFVEGVVWGINSFDQWGVELGKVLAAAILPELEGKPRGAHDPSTAALVERLS
jgi:glucose-6-phosphate isomerase